MDKIAKALVKAQKEFAPALKTATNPHFRSKYVGLDGCIEAVIDALNNNGLFLMQKSHECDDGVKVETIFIHESGETITGGILHVPAAKPDAQGYGSALTYARRYSLMAACGIAPEDDDGNSSVKATATQATENTRKQLQALTPEQGAVEYTKWMQVKSLLVDEDGHPDNERVTDEWGKLASNVRTAIKKHGDSLKAVNEIDSASQEHMNSMTRTE